MFFGGREYEKTFYVVYVFPHLLTSDAASKQVNTTEKKSCFCVAVSCGVGYNLSAIMFLIFCLIDFWLVYIHTKPIALVTQCNEY